MRRWGVLVLVAGLLTVGLVGLVLVALHEPRPFGGGMGGYVSGDPRPYDRAWDQVAPAPLSERARASAVWTGDEVIVIGGNEDPWCEDICGDLAYPDMAAYDPSTDEWRTLSDVPGRQWNSPPGFVAGDQLLMFSFDDGGLLRYDLSEDTWETVPVPPDLSAGRGPFQTPVIVGPDRLVTVSACECPGRRPRVQSLDLAAGEWTALPDDPFPTTARRQVVAVGDDLYLFAYVPHTGGLSGAVLRSGARRWDELPLLPMERLRDRGALAVTGDLIVPNQAPRYTDGEVTSTVGAPAFDTQTGEWTVVSDEVARTLVPDPDTLPATAAGAATVWIGNRWFAFGGRTPSGLTDNAYTWTPPS